MTPDEQLISEEEGRERCAYPDNRGYQTIGVGCLVDKRVPGAGLCDAAIDAQFAHDSAKARETAAALPAFQRCNAVRQAVLVSLCFQLGSLDGWPRFRAALALGDYAGAANNLLYADPATREPSALAKETPARCQREAQMLARGEWVPQGGPE